MPTFDVTLSMIVHDELRATVPIEAEDEESARRIALETYGTQVGSTDADLNWQFNEEVGDREDFEVVACHAVSKEAV